MTASPRSPSPSQAPSGTVRASSASGIQKIDRGLRLGHEDSIHQTGPLCDLYEGLYRAWARPGVQLAGRAIRCCLRLYQESGSCRLEQNLYARSKELVGDRDPRAHEFTIQFRAFDACKSAAATGVPILLAMSSALVERSLEGGIVIVGGLNLVGIGRAHLQRRQHHRTRGG